MPVAPPTEDIEIEPTSYTEMHEWLVANGYARDSFPLLVDYRKLTDEMRETLSRLHRARHAEILAKQEK